MTEDAQHWQRLQALFHLAEVTPEEDRERALAAECSDADLVRRTMTIFKAVNMEGADKTPAVAPPLSGKIGPFTLLRHIGSGGIGSVYLAERVLGGTVQRCALKMLAPHAAGPSFVERFHREQHILASLDHPNITRMLDAGLSESGQPYLTMEYVDGVPFDAYCDEQNLGIAERLRLFLRVCDAVAYAHRNLVVHLDLKPSNILATQDGTVKLLDFGTSKLIQPDSLLTTTVMATPAYASPEQLRNEAVTTACDIYTLGAILFELLSGRRPGDKASVAIMIERAMKEKEPERLPDAVTGLAAKYRGLSENRLRLLLSGDLATIVGKCLCPRPRDRYLSVDALAVDIQRYLDGRPILARPQTTFYKVSKFVRRNRGAVAATLVVTVAMLASLSYAEWRQQQALREGQRAEHMQTFMYALFGIANSNYVGRPTMSINEFLLLGVKLLPQYIHNRADLRTGQISLAKSLLRNSDYRDAQNVLANIMQTASADGDINAETESTALEGDIAYRLGNLDQGKILTARALQLSTSPRVSPAVRVSAKKLYATDREVNDLPENKNIQLLEEAVQEANDNHLPPRQTESVFFDLGLTMMHRARLDDAKSFFRQALQLDVQDPAYTCLAIEPEEELGHIEMWQGHFADSLAHTQHAHEVAVQCFGEGARDAIYPEKFAALAMIHLGRAPEAVPIMRKVVQSERKLDGGAGGPLLAGALYVLANAEETAGNAEEAEKFAKEEIDMTKGKLDPASRGFGAIDLIYATALADQHRDREALPYAEMADKALSPVFSGETFLDKEERDQAHDLVTRLRSSLDANNQVSKGTACCSKSSPN